jgi:small subunit ribosomal protein S6
MRVYEELFIVKPDATEEEVDSIIEQMKGVVAHAGGSVNKVDKWGKRKLAYRVGKFREGEYVLMEFQSGPETVHELERRMRVADLVIKFLTVRIDENLKRIDKRKKQREKRSTRKASMSPASPQPSVAQQMLGGTGAAPGTPGPAPAPAAPMPAAPLPAHPQAVPAPVPAPVVSAPVAPAEPEQPVVAPEPVLVPQE